MSFSHHSHWGFDVIDKKVPNIKYLVVFGQSLWQLHTDEDQVSSTESQSQQSRRLVEHFLLTGAEGEVGPHQWAHSEAQGERDPNHRLATGKYTAKFHLTPKQVIRVHFITIEKYKHSTSQMNTPDVKRTL